MECKAVDCHEDATCAVKDSGMECNCKEGFAGQGLQSCFGKSHVYFHVQGFKVYFERMIMIIILFNSYIARIT